MAPPNTSLLCPSITTSSSTDRQKCKCTWRLYIGLQHATVVKTKLTHHPYCLLVDESQPRRKAIRLDNMNEHIKNVEYAVRGELAIKAETLKSQLNKPNSLPFKTIVNCNIGNPQQLQQKPITFFRQVGINGAVDISCAKKNWTNTIFGYNRSLHCVTILIFYYRRPVTLWVSSTRRMH
jgi:hypothetical protein